MTLEEQQRAALSLAIKAGVPDCTKVYDYWQHPLDTTPQNLFDIHGRVLNSNMQIIDTWFFSRRGEPQNENIDNAWSGAAKKQLARMTELWEVEHWFTVVTPENAEEQYKPVTPSEHTLNKNVDLVKKQLRGHEAIRALALRSERAIVTNISLNDSSTIFPADMPLCHVVNLSVYFNYLQLA